MPAVQWQVSTDGGLNFTNAPGLSTSLTYSFPAGLNMNGYRYRAVLTDPLSSLTTDAAALTVVTDVSSRVRIAQTGFGVNRSSGLWTATMTIINISGSPIAGPVQVAFTKLTPGVTMSNSSGMVNGSPYLTAIPASQTLIGGAAVNVSIQFRNPSNGFINFTPVTYSGPL